MFTKPVFWPLYMDKYDKCFFFKENVQAFCSRHKIYSGVLMVNDERGPGNGTTDSEVNSLSRTQKVRISESVRIVNHVRGNVNGTDTETVCVHGPSIL